MPEKKRKRKNLKRGINLILCLLDYRLTSTLALLLVLIYVLRIVAHLVSYSAILIYVMYLFIFFRLFCSYPVCGIEAAHTIAKKNCFLCTGFCDHSRKSLALAWVEWQKRRRRRSRQSVHSHSSTHTYPTHKMSLYNNKFMDYYNFLFIDLAGKFNYSFIWFIWTWIPVDTRSRPLAYRSKRSATPSAIESLLHSSNRLQLCNLFIAVFFSVTDPRTNDWPLIKSPFPTLTILAAYLYFVRSWGPRYMANRKPYKLENVLLVYNFIQVLVSVFIFYEVKNGVLRNLSPSDRILKSTQFLFFGRVWKVHGWDITVGAVNQ